MMARCCVSFEQKREACFIKVEGCSSFKSGTVSGAAYKKLSSLGETVSWGVNL